MIIRLDVAIVHDYTCYGCGTMCQGSGTYYAPRETLNSLVDAIDALRNIVASERTGNIPIGWASHGSGVITCPDCRSPS